ncbi:unnamed protein product [Pedinophyceae sp. YPF-701]|nr:unnamed protein product [Pedinophyceae sp. YPF-701]
MGLARSPRENEPKGPPPLSKGVCRAIVASRTSGQLILSGQHLTEAPTAVFDIDERVPGDSAVDWWECVELSRLVLSQNSLSQLSSDVARLTSLQALEVAYNDLGALPLAVGDLVHLRLLDCSHNRIRALPPSVADLPALAKLACGHNCLVDLPAALGRAQPALAEVLADHNELATVPPGLSACANLRKLDLSHNRLERLDADVLRGMRSLEELAVDHNALAALPDEIGALPRLRILAARHNRVSALPEAVGGAAALVELHLGFNGLTALPATLAGLAELRTLDVRDNRLSALPEGLAGGGSRLALSLLDLTNNDLSSLPPELGRMTSLRRMPLDGNPIRSIRYELVSGPVSGLLKHLRDRMPQPPSRLDAQAHRDAQELYAAAAKDPVDAVHPYPAPPPAGRRTGAAPGRGVAPPPWGEYEPNPQRVAAAAIAARPGPARAVPIGVEERRSAVRAGNVLGVDEDGLARDVARKAAVGSDGPVKLSFRGAGLDEVPSEVWSIAARVEALDVSGNRLRTLDSRNVALLQAATHLDLSSNQLVAWPLPSTPLPALARLSLARNPRLPVPRGGAFAALNGFALRALDLSGVRAVGDALDWGDVAQLKALEELRVAGCGVAGPCPPEVATLKQLRVLDLSSNRLTTLPEAIEELTRLEELDVANNDLTTLPARLGLLRATLRSVSVAGNPLRAIRRTITDAGTPRLLEYLHSRLVT